MTIEGELLLITSQKIYPKTQLPTEKYTLAGEKVVVYPFSLSVHGNGTINQENSIKNERGDTIARYDPDSILCKGASISGIKLYGFAKKRLGKIIVGGEGRTGAHSCQSTEVKEYGYLHVWQTYTGITDLLHPNTLFNESTSQKQIL